MKLFTKIILMIIDTVAIAFGTYVFITSILYSDKEEAGIGAFMIVFGLLIHYWRTNYFKSTAKTDSENVKKDSSDSGKSLIIGIIVIIAFTICKF